MKKFLCVTSAFILCCSSLTAALAQDKGAIDLSGAFEYKSHTMVPLRATAQRLGYSVEWNGEEKCVALDNREINTTMYIGLDSYYYASSVAIGMSAPMSLGAEPIIKDSTTYVPIEMFTEILGEDVETDGNEAQQQAN